MEVYLTTLFLILFFSFFESKIKLKSLFYIPLFLIIVIQIGLRWETGTDWQIYYNHFFDVNDISIVFLNTLAGFEIGYGFLTYYFNSLFGDYSYFLISHAIFFYYVLFKTAKSYSPFVLISIMFFYASTLGLVGSNRQLIAVGICLLSLPFVENRKPVPFLLTIFIAFLFHTTALLFLFYYFFNININLFTLFLLFFFAIIIGKTNIPLKIFSFSNLLSESANNKVEIYINEAKYAIKDSNLGIIGLIKRILFLILFSFNRNFLSKKLSYYNIIYNGYVAGLLLYFLFSSSLIIIVNRGSLYFNIMESLLLSCQLLVFNNKVNRSIVVAGYFILAILLLFQSISAYPDLFDPYKSIFYNTEQYREVY
jgi:hypothetical protein